MAIRLKILGLFFLLGFLSIFARLAFWQIIKASDLSSQAKSQHTQGEILNANRGKILARDGSVLAGAANSWVLYAYLPDIEKEASKIADVLAPFTVENDETNSNISGALFDEASRIKGLLASNTTWVAIKKRVDTLTKNKVEELKINGIGFDRIESRMYPEASSAAHLLGFVGKDAGGSDTGYSGLEGYYDLVLAGKPGFASSERDARGVPILAGNSDEALAVGGVDLVTTIDKAVQLILDKRLLDGIEKYGAKSGSAVVIDPKTGEILGLAAYPSFDPKEYYKYDGVNYKNPVIANTFEPGSVFKILVMAAGLDAKVIKPDTKCDVCDGPYRIDKYTINTWDNSYRPDETMTDVIVHSDNVGMVFVGQKLGADNLYDYLNKFGIGFKTNVDLQGEVALPLRERGKWSELDLATTTFGQGIAVTSIQLLKAVTAIANKGIMVNPHVVTKLIGNGWEKKLPMQEGERVISEQAASDMTAMMVEAAKNGESKWTYLKGFGVAGKTGTAQIPIAGHYDEEKTIASFIGFVPFEDPKYLMLVTLEEPQTSPWASETAAPLWYAISKDLFLHFGIRPQN